MSVVLIPVKKAAERLSISKSGVYNLMDGGLLPWVKVGSARRVREADIDAYIERNTFGGNGVAMAVPEPERQPESVPLASARPAPKPTRKLAKKGAGRRGQ